MHPKLGASLFCGFVTSIDADSKVKHEISTVLITQKQYSCTDKLQDHLHAIDTRQ